MTKNILFLFLVFLSSAFASEICTIDEWEDFVAQRYKDEDDYRQYDENAPEKVKQFYRENHTNQTVEYVLNKKKEYGTLNKGKMSVWDVLKILDTVIDQSDPDLEMPQIYHAFQTAEALREDGHPRWLILTGFIHDLGKILTYFGEPQWGVVGDTFPVGCQYSEKVVFPDYFNDNPDMAIPEYQTLMGIYSEGCGLNNVHMSWGHDEYLYYVLRDYLPETALYIIRYHSFYPHHRGGAYEHLLSDYDKEMLPWLKLFSRYDLYSKCEETLNIEALLPYYKELVAEFLPDELNW